MAYFKKDTMTSKINFLASEIGLITKTHEFLASGVVENSDGYKIIPAGTIYPTNDALAKGIVFEDVDVTDNDRIASLIIAGRVIGGRLPVAVATEAKTVLMAQGIHFDDEPETTR